MTDVDRLLDPRDELRRFPMNIGICVARCMDAYWREHGRKPARFEIGGWWATEFIAYMSNAVVISIRLERGHGLYWYGVPVHFTREDELRLV